MINFLNIFFRFFRKSRKKQFYNFSPKFLPVLPESFNSANLPIWRDFPFFFVANWRFAGNFEFREFSHFPICRKFSIPANCQKLQKSSIFQIPLPPPLQSENWHLQIVKNRQIFRHQTMSAVPNTMPFSIDSVLWNHEFSPLKRFDSSHFPHSSNYSCKLCPPSLLSLPHSPSAI